MNNMIISIDAEIQRIAGENWRSPNLLANFSGGYAAGWHMAVRDSFRAQLDIRLTPKKGAEGNGSQKDTDDLSLAWTQGARICFDKGHIFYDTPKGYEKWRDALKHISLACILCDGKPNDIKKIRTSADQGFTNKLVEGYVVFELQRPNTDRSRLVHDATYKMSQNHFVEFLKTGDLSSAYRQKQ